MRRHDVGDAAWGRVEPLPSRSGPAGDRRRFVNAVPYVAKIGVPWRDLSERFGKPELDVAAVRPLGRRRRLGLDAVRDADPEVLALDSTAVRAHPAAAGAKKSPAAPAAGPDRRSGGTAAGSGRRPTDASTPPGARSR